MSKRMIKTFAALLIMAAAGSVHADNTHKFNPAAKIFYEPAGSQMGLTWDNPDGYYDKEDYYYQVWAVNIIDGAVLDPPKWQNIKGNKVEFAAPYEGLWSFQVRACSKNVMKMELRLFGDDIRDGLWLLEQIMEPDWCSDWVFSSHIYPTPWHVNTFLKTTEVQNLRVSDGKEKD